MKRRPAPPRASSMLEALRGMGYSTAAAIADIIDNSIAAKATRVELSFQWAGTESYISVLDNGTGMTPGELDKAMRLGEKNPLDERAGDDLGRFGVGLKTASLSQCRSLTVATKKDSVTDCLRWDLDLIRESSGDDWFIIEGSNEGSSSRLASVDYLASGTIVLWEKLDRIVTHEFMAQDFLNVTDKVEQHLAMVFHRYLSDPEPRLELLINGQRISPWDPFLAHHESTYSSPRDRLHVAAGTIELQGHVLPHKDRLKDEMYRVAGGPDGWTSQQGFYVYRNERLIVAGSWLGLGRNRSWTKEQAHQLARIRVDIPNTADADWKLDIRKSIARPPVYMRERLVRLAEDIRERARRVFGHRTQSVRVGGTQIVQAWRAEHFAGGMRYRIDEEHPAVRSVLDDAGGMAHQVRAMLRIIEETVPVQRIWVDATEASDPPRAPFSGESDEKVAAILLTVYRNLVKRKGMSPAGAKSHLLRTEPFDAHQALVAQLPDEVD